MPPRFSGKVSSIIGDLSDAMSMLKDLLPPTNSELDMVRPSPWKQLTFPSLQILNMLSLRIWTSEVDNPSCRMDLILC